jgi:ATP-dependent Clp protease ATP-binding subunit ClpC
VADLFARFSPEANLVFQRSQEEARRLNHNYIGTEPLLLGLARQDGGPVAQVFDTLGVYLAGVRSSVLQIVGRGDRAVTGQIGLTPRAKKVITLAVEEARTHGHEMIGAEHVLLGLIGEGGGIGARILSSASLDRVRAEVEQILRDSGGPEGGADEPGPGSPDVASP